MNQFERMQARDFEALTVVLDSEASFFKGLAGIVTKDRRVTIRRLRPLVCSYVARLIERNRHVYGYLSGALYGVSWLDLAEHYTTKAKEGAF